MLAITRCSELQRSAIESLRNLQQKSIALKRKAIKKSNEDIANMLLGYECVLQALAAELEMWILLKEEKPDAAWDKLIIAQMRSVAAVRAHAGFKHVLEHHQRLEAIEYLVFPTQIFMSSGLIVEHLKCSICSRDYEDCQHLIGLPYMGQFCSVIPENTTLDHVGIVDCPSDKRCRVTEFDVPGGVRNRMTWRVEQKGNQETNAGSVSATILVSG